MWSEATGADRGGHALRIAILTAVATLIVLPLVIFVLGPNMPPGKATTSPRPRCSTTPCCSS